MHTPVNGAVGLVVGEPPEAADPRQRLEADDVQAGLAALLDRDEPRDARADDEHATRHSRATRRRRSTRTGRRRGEKGKDGEDEENEDVEEDEQDEGERERTRQTKRTRTTKSTVRLGDPDLAPRGQRLIAGLP